jgi:hypothetical protein
MRMGAATGQPVAASFVASTFSRISLRLLVGLIECTCVEWVVRGVDCPSKTTPSCLTA